MAKKKKFVKIFGFRLSDTTALMLFLISVMVLFSGGIGMIVTATLDITTPYLGFMYIAYGINIGIGIWLIRKTLKYKRIRK